MYRGLSLVAFVVVVCGMVGICQAEVITIADVPSYIWYNGCRSNAEG